MRPTETFTFHVAKPSPALSDRSLVVPTARALGGGSSVNCTKFIFVVDAQIEIVKSCLLHKGGSLRLRRLGKRIWEWGVEFRAFDTASQKSIEFYDLPNGPNHETYCGFLFIYRQKHIKLFRRILPMANQGRSKCLSHKVP